MKKMACFTRLAVTCCASYSCFNIFHSQDLSQPFCTLLMDPNTDGPPNTCQNWKINMPSCNCNCVFLCTVAGFCVFSWLFGLWSWILWMYLCFCVWWCTIKWEINTVSNTLDQGLVVTLVGKLDRFFKVERAQFPSSTSSLLHHVWLLQSPGRSMTELEPP